MKSLAWIFVLLQLLFYLVSYVECGRLTYRRRRTRDLLPDGERGDECLICLEPMTSRDRPFFDCHHRYHKKCIQLWTSDPEHNSCPYCRNKERWMPVWKKVLVRGCKNLLGLTLECLMQACKNGDIANAKAILPHVDPSKAHNIVATVVAAGHLAILELLFDDPRRRIDLNENDSQPLISALLSLTPQNEIPHQPAYEIFHFLVSHGCDVNARSGMPLQLAAERRLTFAVELLLKRGANINLYPGGTSSALVIALSRSDTAMAGIILQYSRARVNLTNLQQALTIVCERGDFPAALLLLKYRSGIATDENLIAMLNRITPDEQVVALKEFGVDLTQDSFRYLIQFINSDSEEALKYVFASGKLGETDLSIAIEYAFEQVERNPDKRKIVEVFVEEIDKANSQKFTKRALSLHPRYPFT